jgi:hypothetical protein
MTDWTDWNPFVLDERLSLANALATMPSSPIKKIPFCVWLFENPASPFRLAGSANLREHDISHVILGRGLLLQDEAFVIGFVMGNAMDSAGWDRLIYQAVGRLIYRKPFRFRRKDNTAFNLGFDIGQSMTNRNLFTREVRDLVEFSIREVREAMGLERSQLCEWFREEIEALPEGRVSARLRRNVESCAAEISNALV